MTQGVAGAPSGDPDTAIALDNTTSAQHLSAGDVLDFPGTAPFSLEAWAKPVPDDGSCSIHDLISKDDSVNGYHLGVACDGFHFVRAIGGSQDVLISTQNPSTTTWTHVVATYDGRTMLLYVNGAMINGSVYSPGSLADTTFSLTFGDRSTGGRGYTGQLDEVAIYDYALSPAQVAHHYNAGTGATLATTTYGYDKLYRLTSVNGPSGATSYGYDPVGNRLSKNTTSYTYDRADRILTAGTTGYTVNANGNVVARGADSFSYDQANRLLKATVSGTATSYVYDGDGKQVGQAVGTNPTISYAYDVNQPLPMLLTDSTMKYVYGNGLAYAVDSSGNVQVYHTDGLGSVRAITAGNCNVIQTYQTDDFGIPTQTQGTGTQPFQFTGQRHDSSDGLYDQRARMYDPATGRFFSRDPLAGLTKSPQTLNRYAYVENNPVSAMDPSGLSSSLVTLPGPCLFQSIIGGFIFSSIFCSPSSVFGSGKRGQQLKPCPGTGGMPVYQQKIDEYYVQIRGPESGPQGCHVNLEVRYGSNPVVNWHIYYRNNTYVASAPQVPVPVIGSSANAVRDILVGDVLGRLSGVKDYLGLAVLANELPPSLIAALRDLVQYQSGP